MDMDEDEIHTNTPSKVRHVRQIVKVYPPDTPDLSRSTMVQLDIPNKLFGQLAPDVALRSSEAFGGLLQNTARRFAQFVQYFKPLLGKALSVKGLYPPEATTPAPNATASTEDSVKEARSVKLTPATKVPTTASASAVTTVTETVTAEAPRIKRVPRAVAVLPEDDTPDFNRDQVMLDIPDQLFGNSFTIVTNVSKIFGDFMMNTARRYAAFMQYFKPLLGKALVIKGLYPPPPTTTTAAPSTTEAETSSSSSSTTSESNTV